MGRWWLVDVEVVVACGVGGCAKKEEISTSGGRLVSWTSTILGLQLF
jgi:hypothetical protein